MKVKRSQLKQMVREQLVQSIVELHAKDMPAGSSWKVAGKGYAAKNAKGETNYWYGKDMTKNKSSADAFAHSTSTAVKSSSPEKEKGLDTPEKPLASH